MTLKIIIFMSAKNIIILLQHGESQFPVNMRYGSTIKDLISHVKDQHGVYVTQIYNAHNKALPYSMPLRGSITFRAE